MSEKDLQGGETFENENQGERVRAQTKQKEKLRGGNVTGGGGGSAQEEGAFRGVERGGEAQKDWGRLTPESLGSSSRGN